MTNRNKKSHLAKSKIFLIILCLFGMVFSYSCSCRDDGGPYNPTNTPTNFITGEDANNTHLIRLSSDGNNIEKATIRFTNNATVVFADIKDTSSSFDKDDFEYSTEGELSLTDSGKGKLTEAGKSNSVKAVFTLTTTAANITENTKNQTKEIDIAFGKIKDLDIKGLGDTLKTSATKNITLNSRLTTFRFSDATATSDGLEMKPENDNTDINTLTASKDTFIEQLLEILGDSYFNGGVLSGAKLKDGSTPSVTGDPKKNMLEFSVELTPDIFYQLPKSFSTYKISANFKFSDKGTEYVGEWQ